MITKLEAVNRMLAAINERPVNSLFSGLPDAASAQAILEETTRDVVAKGWHCNTDLKYPLSPDIAGLIQIPLNLFRMKVVGKSLSLNVTTRRNGTVMCVYNVIDRTFLFTNTLEVEAVWDMPFEDLTHELQLYIMYKSARRFQKNSVQSVGLDRNLEPLEIEAWAAVQDAEGASEEYNILTGNAHCAYITDRNSRIYGY